MHGSSFLRCHVFEPDKRYPPVLKTLGAALAADGTAA
jgi:hypothetical protein